MYDSSDSEPGSSRENGGMCLHRIADVFTLAKATHLKESKN